MLPLETGLVSPPERKGPNVKNMCKTAKINCLSTSYTTLIIFLPVDCFNLEHKNRALLGKNPEHNFYALIINLKQISNRR